MRQPATEISIYVAEDSKGTTEDEDAFLTCLSFLTWLTNNTSIEDTLNAPTFYSADILLQGIYLCRTTSVYYSWLVFGLQCLVDTRRVLGKHMPRGFEDMISTLQWCKRSLLDAVKLSNTIDSKHGWHTQQKPMIDGLLSAIKGLTEDDVPGSSVDARLIQGGRRPLNTDPWGSFYLGKNHPMICGIALVSVLTDLQLLGVDLLNEQTTSIMTAHLYNAYQQGATVDTKLHWSELEHFIELQGVSNLFVGDLPKKVGDFSRRLALALGLRPTAVKQQVRLTGTLQKTAIATTSPRPINAVSRLCSAFFERRGSKFTYLRGRREPLALMESTIRDNLEDRITKGRAGSTRPTRLSSLQRLMLLKGCLQTDDSNLRQDLFALNLQCTQIARRLQKHCLECYPEQFPRHLFGGSGSAPISTLVCQILHNASGPEHVAVFQEAGELMAAMAKDFSGVENNKTQRRCNIDANATAPVIEAFKTPCEDLIPQQHRGGEDIILMDDEEAGLVAFVPRHRWDSVVPTLLEKGFKAENMRRI